MSVRIIQGDCRDVLRLMEANSVQCCVTSPPYFGLRDYGVDGQIGLEATPDAFVAEMVAVFRGVRRVLREDGTCWLNLGDSYAGSWGAQTQERYVESDDPSWHGSQIRNHPKRSSNIGAIRQAGLKPKDLMMIPARVALALQADGWWLRKDIIWHKPNPMPESVNDRPTSSHEHVFLLTKSEQYFYDSMAIQEPFVTDPKENYETRARITGRGQQSAASARGNDRDKSGGFPPSSTGMRNARDVWTITSQPYRGAHFATMPPELAERCIKAGTKPGDTVLDPFGGAGTTGLAADRLGRHGLLIEINPTYADMARDRVKQECPLFTEVA